MTFPVFPGSNPSGYNLSRSLRFRASASAYLNRTPVSPTNNLKWTYSGWFKRGVFGGTNYLLSAGDATYRTALYVNTDNTIGFFHYNSSTYPFLASTSAVYRDPSSWYHVVFAFDSTQATSSNGLKLYINGVQQTLSITSYTQNAGTTINNTYTSWIGWLTTTSNYLDGYLTEVNFIDGQALTPSSFGSTNATTGVWQPARYTGTYGTNGAYLPFTDNSALTTSSNVGLGKDFSGNGNYWVTTNISITAGTTYDSMTDVPTLTSATAANFSTLNPLKNVTTLSNANLTFSGQSNSVRYSTGTIAVTSGKYYFEAVASVFAPGSAVIGFGVAKTSVDISSPSTSDVYIYNNNGTKYGGGSGSAAYGASFVVGDIVGVALDMDNGTLTFYKNNVSQGTAFTGLTGQTITASLYSYGDVSVFSAGSINFGQRPFTYTPPTGYVALNTYNLPTSTIVKGNTVMDATLYTGNGSTQTITNAAGFQPDFVWVKTRSSGSFGHALFDSVRGAPRRLASNLTEAENTTGSFGQVSSFNSNGFTVATGSSSFGETGANALTYVGWQWQAGQGTTSSNTNGTITSTVSVNASAGFSIVTYTGNGTNPGATIGHGLGVAPAMIICKNRSNIDWWPSYHVSVGVTNTLYLNDTVKSNTYLNRFSAVSSTTFTTGSSGSELNTSANNYVAYCWTPIAGYSAFSSYSGNGSSDGVFVYTGFQPRFIMTKRTDTTGNWVIHDTARNTYNVADLALYPNLSSAEDSGASGRPFDILSNGFKARSTEIDINASGGTYIYAAFATAPFKNSLAR